MKLNDEQILVQNNKIFEYISGSHLYGTNRPDSDKDYRGLFIAPPDRLLNCFSKIEQVNYPEPDDITFYELRKFVSLAANANPNIIEMLWVPDEFVIFSDPIFQKLKTNRDLFLSKKIRHTFSGYAMSQLHRLKGHHKWISNPQPQERPRMSSFCKLVRNNGQICDSEEEILKISQNAFLVQTFGIHQFRVFVSPEFSKKGFFDEANQNPIFVDIQNKSLEELTNKKNAEYIGFLIINQQAYESQLSDWNNYWEWKKNRNPKRSELEEKYGYDIKHAMHLVRLMEMCEEVLSTGEVILNRKNQSPMMNLVKNGEIPYDELILWSIEKDISLNSLCEKSNLQYSANYKEINNIYLDIVFDFWNKRGFRNLNQT